MMRRALKIASAAMLSVACAPQAPVVAPTPSAIGAGFSQTWNAVIDVLSDENIPVKTLDKSSGFLMAEVAGVPMSDESKYADCGSGLLNALTLQGGGQMISRYNVLVRGDSSSSTVKVTANFVSSGMESASNAKTCRSKGVFERQFQLDVKARAEARSHSASK